jgi:hypothetical protein
MEAGNEANNDGQAPRTRETSDEHPYPCFPCRADSIFIVLFLFAALALLLFFYGLRSLPLNQVRAALETT